MCLFGVVETNVATDIGRMDDIGINLDALVRVGRPIPIIGNALDLVDRQNVILAFAAIPEAHYQRFRIE